MANILILNSGLNGIFNACLEIANRFTDQGHQVFISSIKDRKDQVAQNSYDYIQVRPIKFNYARAAKNGLTKHKFYNSLIEELEYKRFQEQLSQHQIDLVLIDIELHEYIIYLSAKKLPFLLLSQWFSLWKAPNNLPLSSNKAPSSALQQNLVWNIFTLNQRMKTTIISLNTMGVNRRNFILYLAKKMNFDLRELGSYQFPLPFIYKSVPVISTTHPDLEFNQESNSNLFYTYPMVFENRIESSSTEFDKDFEFALQQKRKHNKRLIVVTLSSMSNNTQNNLTTLLSTLSKLENCVSIVSLGVLHEEFSTWSNNHNLFLFKSIPQLAALKKADLSINHGGIHTINECIHYKVPMLILSGNKFDQNGCATRVSKYGCGISLFKHEINSKKINWAINELTSKTQFRDKVEELNDTYKIAKSNKVFEHYISKLLSEIVS